MDNCGGTSSKSLKASAQNGCSSKTCQVCSLPQDRDFDAYAAGLIDGEGSFTVLADQARSHMSVVIQVTLASKATGALNALYWKYGGSVRPLDRPRLKEAATARWQMPGRNLRCLIERLLPYMTIKRQQAEICLDILTRQWPKYQGNHKVTAERISLFLDAKKKVEELNRRGPITPEKDYIAQLVGNCWMTRKVDLFGEHWETFSGRFPASGSLRNGVMCERPTWAPRTGESDGSVWPTAKAMSGGGNSNRENRSETGGPDLQEFAAHWQSPQSRDFRDGAIRPETAAKHLGSRPLNEQAQGWSTPRSENAESCGNHPRSEGDSLAGQVKLWKTPHGMGNTDASGKMGGAGGGEFAKQATHWATPSSTEIRQGFQRRPEGMASQQNQQSRLRKRGPGTLRPRTLRRPLARSAGAVSLAASSHRTSGG